MPMLLKTRKEIIPGNWLGPHIIDEDYGFGAYKIKEIDCICLKELINVAHLYIYYAYQLF
jgi:hypothetical protein